MPIIDVHNLTRVYSRRQRTGWFRPATITETIAVSDLSLAIEAGERVAFIGPNGAGKTTTLRMLTGLLYPTSGQVQVDGMVPWLERKKLARSIGLVFGQRSQLWFDLPVIQSFDSLAVIYGLARHAYGERRDQLIETLKLGSLLTQPARSLSLGQRMRCEIAAALLHQPKILFLDEPTIGLDVEAKAILRDYLRAVNRLEDTTIILTSHDTGDIEDICSRVVMIDHGKKLLDQPLWQLRQDFDSGRRVVVTCHEPTPHIAWPPDMIEEIGPHRVVINIDTRVTKLTEAIAAMQAQLSITDLVIERTSLETIIRNLYAKNAVS
jgi:ABC-2 type transport system ATP-binding protein